MNKINWPMKVHAVKLEYRRLKLQNMRHGYFRDINGKRTLVITYDPDDPKTSSRGRGGCSPGLLLGNGLPKKLKNIWKSKMNMMDFLQIGTQDTVLNRQE